MLLTCTCTCCCCYCRRHLRRAPPATCCRCLSTSLSTTSPAAAAARCERSWQAGAWSSARTGARTNRLRASVHACLCAACLHRASCTLPDAGSTFPTYVPGCAAAVLRLSQDVGLQLQLEEDSSKWFPASNSGREVCMHCRLLAACALAVRCRVSVIMQQAATRTRMMHACTLLHCAAALMCQVRDRLVAACERAGVAFVYNASVEKLTPPASSDDSSSSRASSGSALWRVGLKSGASVGAERVILSTGVCNGSPAVRPRRDTFSPVARRRPPPFCLCHLQAAAPSLPSARMAPASACCSSWATILSCRTPRSRRCWAAILPATSFQVRMVQRQHGSANQSHFCNLSGQQQRAPQPCFYAKLVQSAVHPLCTTTQG